MQLVNTLRYDKQFKLKVDMAPPMNRNWQFAAFLSVGVVATAAHYLVMGVLASGLGVSGVVAASGGYLAGALVSYVCNYRVTFRSTQSHVETLPRFLGVVLLGFAVNTQIVAAGITWLHLHYLLAQGIATVVVFLLNFTLSKVWAFKER
ncbi:GtrA family protein [Massilia suwonensis]|uniref:GtrA family protein n=2 Tax=Massilia suwonensis TaxID=648895 RepID=A0ABW0MHB9_9BURK